ncbi:MAG: hypothetical protein SFZ23_12925 [Planctomycetota bacterium]|nr:hypothetical protein [Planctomycetota bacterium]
MAMMNQANDPNWGGSNGGPWHMGPGQEMPGLRQAAAFTRSAERNTLGLAGFITSLVALVFSLGLLSPVAMIISFFGLFKKPRGFALAGFVLGLVGSIGLLLLMLLGVFAIILGGLGIAAVAPHIERTVEQHQLAALVQSYHEQHRKLPLTLAELDAHAGTLTDSWDRPYRYFVEPAPEGQEPTRFVISSDGPDSMFDTPDDERLVVDIASGLAAEDAPTTSRRHRTDGPR